MAKEPEDLTAVGPHKIVAVLAEEPRPWDSTKGGPMLSWRIDVEAGEQTLERVELAQKKTTAKPEVGQELDGHVQRRFFGTDGVDLQFRKAARFGGGGGGGSGRAWKPRPDDAPVVYAAKQAQIVCQHSQNMALRVLELAEKSGESTETLMSRLGVLTETGDGQALGLVEAFSRDASLAAARAWRREHEKKAVSDALADLS